MKRNCGDAERVARREQWSFREGSVVEEFFAIEDKGVGEGALEGGVGAFDGFDKAAAEGQVGGNGGGVGAAAAVRIHILDTPGAQAEEDFPGAGEKVEHRVAGDVAALEEDGDAEGFGEGEGGGFEGFQGGGGAVAEEDGGFVEVGRDERRAGKEALGEGGDGGGVEQERAGGGDHHGVNHGGEVGPGGEEGGNLLDNGGGGQHASFDGADGVVGEDLVNLRTDESGRDGMDGGDASGVLRGEGGEGGGAVNAEGGEGEQVGLDAGGGAGIGTGDGEGGDGHGRRKELTTKNAKYHGGHA